MSQTRKMKHLIALVAVLSEGKRLRDAGTLRNRLSPACPAAGSNLLWNYPAEHDGSINLFMPQRVDRIGLRDPIRMHPDN